MLYSSYIVALIVLVFFSGYLTFLAVFPYSPGFAGGTSLYFTPFQFRLLHFTLLQFTLV